MFSIVSQAPAPHNVWWFNVPLRHSGVAGNTLLWAGQAPFRVVEVALDICVCVPSRDSERKIPESLRLEGTCGDNLVQPPCSKGLPPQTVLIRQDYSSSSPFFHHWIGPFGVLWQDSSWCHFASCTGYWLALDPFAPASLEGMNPTWVCLHQLLLYSPPFR